MCGKGLGLGFMTRFLEDIFAASGSKKLLAGPHPENAKAIWCLARLGFRPIEDVMTLNEGQLMVFDQAHD